MRTILSWSSGKDSAWALHRLRQTPGIDVAGLVTTVSEDDNRVAMHGVRRTLVEAQARAAGLALHVVPLPNPCPNEAYAARMGAFVARARSEGAEAMAFGDLFLADIRAYREERLAGTGIAALFPLWGLDTRQLAGEMIADGLEATITCIDARRLARSHAGRRFDAAFLAALPPGVDPCGENGEFHTLVTGGPMFAHAIATTAGDVVKRDGFVYADILPGTGGTP